MVLRLLKQFFLILAALTIILFFMEGFVRLFHPQLITPNYHEPAFGVPTHLKANYQVDLPKEGNFPTYRIETNQTRFRRSKDISYEKPQNTYRIMFLGDSVFFGMGVNNNELFAHHLEKLLNQNTPGKRFEVINASVPGWALLQFLTYFKNEGYKYSPDLVVLSSFPDDIRQRFVDYFCWEKLEYDDEVIHLKDAQFDLFSGLPFHTVMNWLGRFSLYELAERRSHLLNLVRVRLSALDKTPKRGFDCKHQRLDNFLKTFDYKGYHTVTWQFDEFELKLPKLKNNAFGFYSRWSDTDPMMAEANLPLYFFTWHQLFKSIQHAGAQPLVLEIPAREEVLKMTHVDRTQSFLNWFPEVPQFNLLEPLTNFQTHIPVSLFFPWDNHWSPAGHRLIAQLIYNLLAQPESFLTSRVSLPSQDITIPKMTAALMQANRHVKRRFDASHYLLFLDGLRQKNQNQIKKAIHTLERYLELKPNDHEGHFQLGITYMITKNYGQALLHLKQAQSGSLMEQKKYRYTYTFIKFFGQAWRLFQEKHYLEALSILDQAEALQGIYLDKVLALKATIYLKQRNLEFAKRYFEKAIAVNPKFSSNYQNLGNVYFDTGKFRKAALAFEKSLELNPNNLRIHLLTSLIYKKVGEDLKSLEWFKSFMDRCGDSCDTFLQEGFHAFFGGCGKDCKRTMRELKSFSLSTQSGT